MKFYLIENIYTFDSWEKCFKYFIEKSEKFQAIFLKDRNYLNKKELEKMQRDFLSFKDIEITDYEDTENSVKFESYLTKQSRDFFKKYYCEFCESRLSLADKTLLKIYDYTFCELYISDNEIKELENIGIDTSFFASFDTDHELGEEWKNLLDGLKGALNEIVEELHDGQNKVK